MKKDIKLVGPGAKAKLWTQSNAVAASNPGQIVSNVVQLPQLLPILLAGPVVRRVDASQANIWLATSADLKLICEIFDTSAGNQLIGDVQATKIKLGDKLFIYLATVEAPIPVKHLLAYNFDVSIGNDPNILGFDGDVLLNPSEVTVGGLSLPTFFRAQPQSDGVRVAHASCRKFHGAGFDALPKLQAELDRTASILGERPSAFHMTGDQIYADDVADILIEGISEIGRIMLGWDELFPPSNKKVVDFTQGTRSFVRNFGLSVDSNAAGNHLLGFGDFAAMYVLAWSPEIWTWKGLRVKPLEIPAGMYASPSARQVLANVPCYMICDDHEVTDDWNLNSKWIRDTGNAVARRLIANALGAYWAFQAFGNDTGGRDAPVQSAVSTYLQGKGADPGSFESAMLGFHQWHYTAPTSRPTIVLDTRTRRSFASIPAAPPDPPAILNPPPGLLDAAAFSLFGQAIGAAGGSGDDPLIVVSPAPFFGYQKAEDGVAIAANLGAWNRPIDTSADPEAWGFNPPAFAQFLKTLAQSGRRRFLILGGDVHYGYTAIASCTLRIGGNPAINIAIVQATSSALHNKADGLSAAAIYLVNDDNSTYLSIGNFRSDGKYQLQKAEFLKRWNLGIPANWDLQVRWKYIKMGPHSVVEDNNVGIVIADSASASHTLFAASGSPVSVSIRWADILTQVPTPVTSLP